MVISSLTTPTLATVDFLHTEQLRHSNEGGNHNVWPDGVFVDVTHISNNQRLTCTPIPDEWDSRKGGFADGFVPANFDCFEEIDRKLRSGVPTLLAAISAPFESMMAAREAHSVEQVSRAEQRVKSLQSTADRHASFVDLDLSLALNSARGAQPGQVQYRIELGQWKPSQSSSDMFKISLAQHARVVGAVEDPALRTVAGQVAERFGRSIRKSVESTKCEAPERLLDPPLGWTLSLANRAMLRCLALREALRVF